MSLWNLCLIWCFFGGFNLGLYYIAATELKVEHATTCFIAGPIIPLLAVMFYFLRTLNSSNDDASR